MTPQHIVIGRDGRIQYVGHLADARLDAALLAARQPVAASATARSAPALAERPRINVAITSLRNRGGRLQTPNV